VFAYVVCSRVQQEDDLGLHFQRRYAGSGDPCHQPTLATPNSAKWQQPARLPNGARDAITQKADDEEILRRAKELCAHNGAVWDSRELGQAERWQRNKIVTDDAGRRKYLALAREELSNESGVA
jgi:hypothetical protein